jgi:putative membrane protein (TIGR04086 family)
VFVGIRSIPAQAVFLFSLTSAVIGAFLGSYVAVRINKEKGMICGMSIGFGIFFILLLVSVSVASEPFTLVSLIKLFSMMLSGAVGGIIGVNKRR